MLPSAKIGWGVALGILGALLIGPIALFGVPLLLAGGLMLGVGLLQRTEPEWQVRSLVRKAQHEPASSAAYLQQAISIDPENPEALAASAEASFLSDEWTNAAELYEKYLSKAPSDWQAEAHLGCSYLNAGQPDQAITHIQKVRSLPTLTEETHATLTNALVLAFLRKSDPNQALEIIKTLPLQRHTLDGHLQQSLLLRAVAHYQSHQVDKAVGDLDRLYALNPNYPDLQDIKDRMRSGTYVVDSVYLTVKPEVS